MLRRARILMTFVALVLVTSTAYTNCGMVKSSHTEDSSAAKSAIIAACESTLKQQFNNSYRPFLMQSSLCLSCHSDSGVSPVKFASNDLNVGFSAFMGVGPDAVDRNALSTTHAAGVTGPTLQSNLTSVHLTWDPAFHDYQVCLAGASTTTGAADAADTAAWVEARRAPLTPATLPTCPPFMLMIRRTSSSAAPLFWSNIFVCATLVARAASASMRPSSLLTSTFTSIDRPTRSG